MPRPIPATIIATLLLALAVPAAATAAGDPVAGEIIVSPGHRASSGAVRDAVHAAGARLVHRVSRGRLLVAPTAGERGVPRALSALRRRGVISAATPRLIVRAADVASPDDTGLGSRAASARGGWAQAQWDLTGPFGVNAPAAWAMERKAGRVPGGGAVAAIIDSGVAYANRPPFARSPDIAPASVVAGRDFVDDDSYPNDRFGHGTFVASTIVAAANNGYGMVGEAYGARVMPVRVLDGDGYGTAARVARGMRWAVDHGADVLNVSIELFDSLAEGPESITVSPEIRRAVVYAGRHRVPVVAATGNSAGSTVPSRRLGDQIIYVGASTEHGCLADYSNFGRGMDLVAPGGGRDALIAGAPNCRPGEPQGRNVLQVTFKRPDFKRFAIIPDGLGHPGRSGTSMAAPHVTAAIALLIGSRALGRHPSTFAIQRRLTATTRASDAPRYFGAGLLDAAAALRGTRSPEPAAPSSSG